MPQFDSQFFTSQIFWVCVCFGILWSAMQWWVIPSVRWIQAQRNTHVQGVLKEAERLNVISAEMRTRCKVQHAVLEEELHNRIQDVFRYEEAAMVKYVHHLRVVCETDIQKAQEELISVQENFLEHMKHDVLDTAQRLVDRYTEEGEYGRISTI